MLERKHGEQEFHNRRQAERAALNVATFERRYSNFKFYSVTARSLAAASEWIRVHSGRAGSSTTVAVRETGRARRGTSAL